MSWSKSSGDEKRRCHVGGLWLDGLPLFSQGSSQGQLLISKLLPVSPSSRSGYTSDGRARLRGVSRVLPSQSQQIIFDLAIPLRAHDFTVYPQGIGP